MQERGVSVRLQIIRTEGDEQQSTPLSANDVGAFVRRIEEALLSGAIDFAVHSLKDLPTTQPEGLGLAAVLPRHDPRDVLLTVEGHSFEQLGQGASVGTCSPRRVMQLAHHRRDLEFRALRGNVDTRIRRLREGRFDAIVLALAGVERLGIRDIGMYPLPVESCLPAVGQGALAIETRVGDAETIEPLRFLADEGTTVAVDAERACLRALGGGCLAPATAFASRTGEELWVRGAVGSLDGRTLVLEERRGAPDQATALGEAVAAGLLDRGAGDLLAHARSSA